MAVEKEVLRMIQVEHLTKYYGDVLAVSDLSFEIGEGHVYGFLGANGAGKSTTMNMITGCLSATEGHVRIDGFDIFEQPAEAKKRIGYLPEQPPLYMSETPEEYLRFVGEAKGLRGAALREQMEEVIRQTGIDGVRHRRISALSKGYKQRVGIAQALLGNPQVIILDEPTVGLDPIQIIEIRDLIRDLGHTHTVLFSSHILSEVQAICDEILVIAKGKLVAFDTADNLEKQLLTPNEIHLLVDAPAAEVETILADVEGISDVSAEEDTPGRTSVRIETSGGDIYDATRALFFAFASAQKPLLEMTTRKANLEDIFLELTEKTEDPAAELSKNADSVSGDDTEEVQES